MKITIWRFPSPDGHAKKEVYRCTRIEIDKDAIRYDDPRTGETLTVLYKGEECDIEEDNPLL